MTHDRLQHAADQGAMIHGETDQAVHRRQAYPLFAVNMLLSFVTMYLLMFTMVDTWGDFFNNLNMGYMALTMLAPMGALMLVLMRGMYVNRTLNTVLYAAFALMFALAVIGIRTQMAIGDRQFIRAMIPHHSGAILMCREADITDGELRALCDNIQKGQRQEIEQMKAILNRLQTT
jgi:uncharacterized protein (DUF305 family)